MISFSVIVSTQFEGNLHLNHSIILQGSISIRRIEIVFLSWRFFVPQGSLNMAITLKQARKILGSLAAKISDEELEKEIKSAELLKNLYMSVVSSANKYNHGKA
jgi:hypothetical protein